MWKWLCYIEADNDGWHLWILSGVLFLWANYMPDLPPMSFKFHKGYWLSPKITNGLVGLCVSFGKAKRYGIYIGLPKRRTVSSS